MPNGHCLKVNIRHPSCILTIIFKCMYYVEIKSINLFQSVNKFRATLLLCISLITGYYKYAAAKSVQLCPSL